MKNNPRTPLLAVLSVALYAAAPAQATVAPQQDAPADVAAIQSVMENYHKAVVGHDGDAMTALFLPEGSTWLTVLDDDAYQGAQGKSPKVRVGNYRDFAKYVSTSTARLDPQSSNISIHTNGTIASVYFDFMFFIDGKVQNRGAETWQLVKSTDGWRIAAVTYSASPARPR